jgi:uncharacterized protein (DUF2141 family)
MSLGSIELERLVKDMSGMKYIFATLLTATAACLEAGTIRIRIEGIDTEKGGTVRIGLYGEKGFPDEGQELRGREIEVEREEAVVEFEDVAAGSYAIALYQDINGDEQCDRGLFGIPTEPVGISNNAIRRLGPPRFKDAAFEVPEDGTVALEIKIKS